MSSNRGNGQRRQRPEHVRRAYPGSVPSTREVVPSASVSIVLKQDQGTGNEVQGIVQDVLTSGDHPRGIKVRLTDGRVGRVQRMSTAGSTANIACVSSSGQYASRQTSDEQAAAPPARSLADYMSPSQARMFAVSAQDTSSSTQHDGVDMPGAGTAGAQCPICHDFEGDEYAVSRHVEQHFE